MKKYQYQTLRYTHDIVTGEFVNIGIVMFCPEMDFLKFKTISKYRRISEFFNNVKGSYILKSTKHLQHTISIYSQRFNSELPFKAYQSIDEITSEVLPEDDSSMHWSQISQGITLSPDDVFENIYQRYIGKYESPEKKISRTDSDAWREVYKKHFDKYGITSKLKSYSIKTANDMIKFDLGWKNDELHCYHPLSFDLINEEDIKNKVYRWSGIINELQTTNEKMDLFLLTLPAKTSELNKFIENKLKSNTKNIVIIRENGAEDFAMKVAKQIEHLH